KRRDDDSGGEDRRRDHAGARKARREERARIQPPPYPAKRAHHVTNRRDVSAIGPSASLSRRASTTPFQDPTRVKLRCEKTVRCWSRRLSRTRYSPCPTSAPSLKGTRMVVPLAVCSAPYR